MKFLLIPLAILAGPSISATQCAQGTCIYQFRASGWLSDNPGIMAVHEKHLFDTLDDCLDAVKADYDRDGAVCVLAHGWTKNNPNWEKY